MRDTFECVERGVMDSKIIDDALDFVKEVFSTDFSGHDYFHTLRVYKMAVRIAQEEGANQEIVALAALWHDVDDIKLSPETHEHKDRAVGFLRQHAVNEATIQAICAAIDEVSFSGTDSVVLQRLRVCVFKTQIAWMRLEQLASHAPLLMAEVTVVVCMTQMSHRPLI